MKKRELIEHIARRTGYNTSDVEAVLETLEEIVAETLKEGGEVGIGGFGKFFVREREARDVEDAQTGEVKHIAAGKVPVFHVGKHIRESI